MTTVPRQSQVNNAEYRGANQLAQILPFRVRPPVARQRILHVNFSSRLGGAERYCIDLANQQAALGYEVHVAGLPGSPLAASLAAQVQFHRFALPVLRSTWLTRLIARLGVDVAHAHLGPACKALGQVVGPVRKVATLHTGYKPHHHARMDGVICLNTRQSFWLSGYEGQARIISGWLPAPMPAVAQTGLREQLGLPADALVVGAAGRLHASTGCDLLIKAFRQTASANAVLVFLGDGRRRRALEMLREADGRVHFLGSRRDTASFLEGVDVFVSASREEAFGLITLDAMRAGLPVIATLTDGSVEYLRNQPVTLVEAGSVHTLASALSRTLGRTAASLPYDLRTFDPGPKVAEIMDFYDALSGQEQFQTLDRAIAL